MRPGVSRPSHTPITALRMADSEALSRKQIAAGILCDPKYNARNTASPGDRDKFCSAASRLIIQILLSPAAVEWGSPHGDDTAGKSIQSRLSDWFTNRKRILGDAGFCLRNRFGCRFEALVDD